MSRLPSDSTPLTYPALALKLAAAEPREADLLDLFTALDDHLAALPLTEMVAEAGRWLVQLIEIVHARADLLLDEWDCKYRPTEPVLSEGFLSRWVVHTQSLDLSKWLEEPTPHNYPQGRNSPTTQVGVVDKEELLNWVDNQLEDFPEVMTIPEDEDPTAWMALLASFWDRFEAHQVGWADLCSLSGLPPGALLLAVLLGDYPHYREPGTDFYDNHGVWVQTIPVQQITGGTGEN